MTVGAGFAATIADRGTMQEFIDESGEVWSAAVVERPGPDYKGRFVLHMTSSDGTRSVTVEDIAWNSSHTARRTLDTMSTTELRRRLRIGLGRQSAVRVP